MRSFFVIDVESVGLHGEGFAVAGGLYLENGAPQWEFFYCCPIEECLGQEAGRHWVKENVPVMEITHRSPVKMRHDFWKQWEKAKSEGALMAADCLWPVEAGFVAQCVSDEPKRAFLGPYPFVEISSVMMSAGMGMDGHSRSASELPAHNPLCDSRQSARLLCDAIGILSSAQNASEQNHSGSPGEGMPIESQSPS